VSVPLNANELLLSEQGVELHELLSLATSINSNMQLLAFYVQTGDVETQELTTFLNG